MKFNLGFFASGNGTNFETIIRNIQLGSLEAKACVLISNNPDAGALRGAERFRIPYYCINERNLCGYTCSDEAILGVLRKHEVNFALLCGYMKPIGETVVKAFHNRMLNIHPALLPKYGGKGMYGHHVHEAVIASDDIESGATVHLVDNEYDHGKILAQIKVPRYLGDTAISLGERVLRFEHVLYSQVLRDINKGLIDLDRD